MAPATGFVVAGGASRRMGRDKALVPWNGTPLLDLALARLRECCHDVVILCGPEPRYADRGVPVAVDVAAGKGPLGALMTGLRHLRGGAGPAVLLAVDLPGVPAALLAHLVALLPGHDLVVPVTARGPEPLCAVYAATCLPPVEEAVGTGDLKMTSFWPAVRRREVGEAELAHFGDPAALFRNINTPGDLTPE